MRIAMEFERAAGLGREGLLTEAACRKVISELHEQTSGRPIAFHTVEGWIGEWLANCTGTTAPSTLERYTGTCRDFLSALGDRATVTIAALTPEDIRRYRDSMRKRGHSAATCNQAIKILQTPLEHCQTV